MVGSPWIFFVFHWKDLQRAKLRRLTTPTRKAASAYNVTVQGLHCVNEYSSYFHSGKPMSHVQHDVQSLWRGYRYGYRYIDIDMDIDIDIDIDT